MHSSRYPCLVCISYCLNNFTAKSHIPGEDASIFENCVRMQPIWLDALMQFRGRRPKCTMENSDGAAQVIGRERNVKHTWGSNRWYGREDPNWSAVQWGTAALESWGRGAKCDQDWPRIALARMAAIMTTSMELRYIHWESDTMPLCDSYISNSIPAFLLRWGVVRRSR